jgi:hypothetical protein
VSFFVTRAISFETCNSSAIGLAIDALPFKMTRVFKKLPDSYISERNRSALFLMGIEKVGLFQTHFSYMLIQFACSFLRNGTRKAVLFLCPFVNAITPRLFELALRKSIVSTIPSLDVDFQKHREDRLAHLEELGQNLPNDLLDSGINNRHESLNRFVNNDPMGKSNSISYRSGQQTIHRQCGAPGEQIDIPLKRGRCDRAVCAKLHRCRLNSSNSGDSLSRAHHVKDDRFEF